MLAYHTFIWLYEVIESILTISIRMGGSALAHEPSENVSHFASFVETVLMAQLDNLTFDHVPMLCFWIRLASFLVSVLSVMLVVMLDTTTCMLF